MTKLFKKDTKLAPKYYGPYKVLQRIGSMSYKLELPPYSHVHPNIHVSCLNKVIDNKILIQTILPEINEQGKIILEPETICEIRIKHYEIEQLLSTSSNGRTYQWKR
jgi:hypothetical protein